MKRAIALLLALIMTFTLCACGGTAPETDAETAEETAESTPEPTPEPTPEITIDDGIDYYRGENGKEKDLEKAREIFESFGEDNAEALYWLGELTLKDGNTDGAIAYFEKSAELGFTSALTSLGATYAYRINDLDKAAYYFDQVLEKEDAEALDLCDVGSFYAFQKHDMNKAAACYEQALAMEESALILLDAGSFYYMNKEYDKAFECFTKSNEKDSSSALAELGRCYLRGEGTEPDYEKAFNYLEKAAAGEDINAYNALQTLATMYEGGFYVEQDMAKAIEALEKAKEIREKTNISGTSYIEDRIEQDRYDLEHGIKPEIGFVH